MKFKASIDPERVKEYDKSSEILPQICSICSKMVQPRHAYMFNPTPLKRVYYHRSCKYEDKEEETQNGY